MMRLRTMSGILAMVLVAACGGADEAETEVATEEPQVVNVYTSRHYDTDLALYEQFTEQTGIAVNWQEAGADALIERMTSEGEFSPVDVFITVDAGRLWRAVEAGVLSPTSSDLLEERVPANLRHEEGYWYGFSTRARVIIYNKEAGMPSPLSTYADLADAAHAGKVCIRSSSNIYNLSLMASLIAHEGEDAARGWAEGVVANFARPPQGNDTAQVRAVAAGECQISLVNTYYLARLAASDAEEDRAVAEAVGVIFPNQEDRGTHINISGGGVATHAPNRDNAVAFLEYLTSPAAQAFFSDGNNEYPVVEGVPLTDSLAALGEFKADPLQATVLGENQRRAVELFDEAGWP